MEAWLQISPFILVDLLSDVDMECWMAHMIADAKMTKKAISRHELASVYAAIMHFRYLFATTLCTALPRSCGRPRTGASPRPDDSNPNAENESLLSQGFTAFYPNFETLVHVSDQICFLGPLYFQDTTRFEHRHQRGKQFAAMTNRKNVERDVQMMDERARAHRFLYDEPEHRHFPDGRLWGRIPEKLSKETQASLLAEHISSAKKWSIEEPDYIVNLFRGFHLGGSRVERGHDIRIEALNVPPEEFLGDAISLDGKKYLAELEYISETKGKSGTLYWLGVRIYRNLHTVEKKLMVRRFELRNERVWIPWGVVRVDARVMMIEKDSENRIFLYNSWIKKEHHGFD